MDAESFMPSIGPETPKMQRLASELLGPMRRSRHWHEEDEGRAEDGGWEEAEVGVGEGAPLHLLLFKEPEQESRRQAWNRGDKLKICNDGAWILGISKWRCKRSVGWLHH